MLVATGCGMVDMVLAMAGRTSWNLVNVLVALAVTIGLDVLLIPRLGALGAAIGLACAMVANNLLPLIQVGRALGCTRSAPGTRAAALLVGGLLRRAPPAGHRAGRRRTGRPDRWPCSSAVPAFAGRRLAAARTARSGAHSTPFTQRRTS